MARFTQGGSSASSIPVDGVTGAVLTKNTANDYDVSWKLPDTTVTPILTKVSNATGSVLAKGSVVYISGANGTHVQVSLAHSDLEQYSSRSFGFIYDDIANGADGYVIAEGYLTGLNTQGLTAGQQLYLSTTPGQWTTTKPFAPNHLVYVGVVARANQNNGSIYVKVQNGYELDEIHDTNINHNTTLNTGDILQYQSNGLWQNTPTISQSNVKWNAITDWAANTSYSSGDLVNYQGVAYRRKTAGTSGSTFDASMWNQTSPSVAVPVLSSFGMSTTAIETAPRQLVTSTYSYGTSAIAGPTLNTGPTFLYFFTPLVTTTVNTLSFYVTSVTGGSSTTPAISFGRMAIYALTAEDIWSGQTITTNAKVSLVARTGDLANYQNYSSLSQGVTVTNPSANIAVIGNTGLVSAPIKTDANNNSITSYTLVAGTRYALAITLNFTTGPTIIMASLPAATTPYQLLRAVSPRINGTFSLSGADLPTTPNFQVNPSATPNQIWMRASYI
jgi:hypothetical protein